MQVFNEKQILKVTIKSINEYGFGITSIDKTWLEVPKSYPNEILNISLEKKINQGKIFKCKIQKIIKPCPDRIAPLCKHSGHCSGCTFDTLDYQKQLQYKVNKIRNIFGESNDIIPSEKIWGYRNQATFVFSIEKDKYFLAIPVGRESIPIEKCIICPNPYNNIIQSIKKIAAKYHFSIYDPLKRKGFIRGVMIRQSTSENTFMIIFFTKKGSIQQKDQICEELIEDNPQIASVYQNSDELKIDTLSHSKKGYSHLYGDFFLIDRFDKKGIKFKISPSSLTYPNHSQGENIYQFIVNALNLSGKEKVLDLYCGVGLNSIFLAKNTRLVYGLDRDKNSIKDAVSNSHLNKIENTIFINTPIEKLLKFKDIIDDQLNILIIKPPIDTLSQEIYQAIAYKEFDKIVYISSRPEIMKKNIDQILQLGYYYKIIQPFDVLPHTNQVETVVILEKKKKIKVKRKK